MAPVRVRIWTGEEPDPPLVWMLKDPGLEVEMDEPVWVGVMGVRNDSTAVVTVAAREGGTVAARPAC